jgi:hypothetical protein
VNKQNKVMIKANKIIGLFAMVSLMMVLLVAGCKKDDEPLRETSYALIVEDVLGVTGDVTFVEYKNGLTSIDIKLNNAPSGTYAASLCQNSAVEGGADVVALNPVGASGESSTFVSTLTYGQLIAYDGHVKVLKSSSPDVILAMGDIGGNEITATSKTYNLSLIEPYGVSGSAFFQKRANENTLVTISLTGTIAGASYPSSINLGSVASIGGGPIMKTLNNVNGTSGKGYTNIRKLDSGINITYDNWLVYQGYLNIYQTLASIENIISQGDIGSN